MNRACVHLAAAGLALVAAFGAPEARAQLAQPNGYTWGELALLPEYCKDVQGVLYGDATNPSPNAGKWVGLMGGDFWHLHHYCRALNLVRQGNLAVTNPSKRASLYARAVGDYEYTIKNCSASNPLMPEILLRYGELMVLMKNLEGAGEAFEQARKLKPDYWPAYTAWIDVLVEIKSYVAAKALAEEGLKQAPDSVELRKRLAALERGGTPRAEAGRTSQRSGEKLAQAPSAAASVSGK